MLKQRKKYCCVYLVKFTENMSQLWLALISCPLVGSQVLDTDINMRYILSNYDWKQLQVIEDVEKNKKNEIAKADTRGNITSKVLSFYDHERCEKMKVENQTSYNELIMHIASTFVIIRFYCTWEYSLLSSTSLLHLLMFSSC